MTTQQGVWLGFTGLVLALLVLDLGVLNRKSHVLSVREAATWSAGLISLALLFGLFVLRMQGTQKALEYYAGYLIELSLSVDAVKTHLRVLFGKFGIEGLAQNQKRARLVELAFARGNLRRDVI